MKDRAFSLDAFRGYAILTMILSGTIVTSVLPAWMSHAQVGPRSGFTFDPSIYGITWVDLVFPFFLFSMGAAFPFSIGKKLEEGKPKIRIIFDCILRGLRLTFFAIFIQHMYPWGINLQDTVSWGISIMAFLLMFPMFMRIHSKRPEWIRITVEVVGYAIGIAMLLLTPYDDGRKFGFEYSNIIILVLANMAVFGSLIYLFTYHCRWARIAVLPFIMAVFLGSQTEGSWIVEVMNFTPLRWMYRFYYLKYLFIVIPGSIAGDYLRDWLNNRDMQEVIPRKHVLWKVVVIVSIIVWNLYGLYTRQLVLNLCGTIFLVFVLYLLLRGSDSSNNSRYWHRLFVAGAYLLMLGLFFEAYEGGIRKDDSTYSYYFVTSGLAFMGMMLFSIVCDVYRMNWLVHPLETVGQNPMIAYAAPQLFILPLLNLTGFSYWLDMLNQNAWQGFLRGVIVTALAICIAAFCTKKKWFWRT